MPRLLRAPRRQVRSYAFDSARWDGYRPREGDIIIATYPRCGTTWMQRIVGMLVFGSAEPRSLDDLSPWFDMRAWGPVDPILEQAEGLTHRRFFKTHLPLDALPIHDGVKFIHVARDGRDAALSLHNHLLNFSRDMRAQFDHVAMADPKFRHEAPPTPDSPAQFFAEWVKDGGALGDPGGSFFHIVKTYWDERNASNVILMHYSDLLADLAGEMKRLARFLDIAIPDRLWPELVEAARFANMRRHGDLLLPHARRVYSGGVGRFLHRGTNGRWRGVFHPEDVARYEAATEQQFTPELARWVRDGRHAMHAAPRPGS